MRYNVMSLSPGTSLNNTIYEENGYVTLFFHLLLQYPMSFWGNSKTNFTAYLNINIL